MGKAGKWIRNFLTGKKDKEKQSKNASNLEILASNSNEHHPTTPTSIPQPTTPKEKRWSFRCSSTAAPGRQDSDSVVKDTVTTPPVTDHHMTNASKNYVLAVAAAADAAVAAAKAAAAAVIQLTAAASGRASAVEEASAIKIQSVFRAYLVCIS